MSRIIYVSVLLMLFSVPIRAQHKLSPEAKISILTCSEGQELYAAFGHSAIRVLDSPNNIDLVFNYGTFDFRTSWFYLKFANGNLDYLLSISEYSNFLVEYFRDNRNVTEQVLNLEQSDMQRLFDALVINYEPQNRNYRYDFFYDNCATRIVDMVSDNVDADIVFTTVESSEGRSFRQLLHHYFHHSPWTETGLALILGMPADKIASVKESCYLPHFLMLTLEQAILQTSDGQNRPLVKSEVKVFDFQVENMATVWTPVLLFSILLGLSVVLTVFLDTNKLIFFDRLLFFVSGGVGVLISFLWFISNHSVTANNLNILWAMPTFLYLAFASHKKKTSLMLFALNFLCIAVFLIGWNLIPQAFPLATIPIALMLGMRMLFILRRNA